MPTFLGGATDLAIEIVSPESVERDNVQKFVEYETAGIREYWLIDYTNESVFFLNWTMKGVTSQPETFDGTFYSKVLPGFFIRGDWLCQERLATLDALRKLKVF